MTYYAETGPGFGVEESKLLIRDSENGPIQRYDIKTKSWVTDYEMCQIFTGDIECDVISESTANEIIARL